MYKALMSLIVLGAAILLFSACQNDKNHTTKKPSTDLTLQIKALSTDSLKKEFLLDLWSNTNLTLYLDSIKTVTGKQLVDQSFYEEYRKNTYSAYEKLAVYLDEFGYPDSSVLYAVIPEDTLRWNPVTMVPTHVIGATSDLEIMERYIPLFYKAYKDGNLGDRRLSNFLQRIHSQKFGRRVEFDGPFTQEEELMALYDALDVNVNAIEF